jgi:hypothetical protein
MKQEKILGSGPGSPSASEMEGEGSSSPKRGSGPEVPVNKKDAKASLEDDV